MNNLFNTSNTRLFFYVGSLAVFYILLLFVNDIKSLLLVSAVLVFLIATVLKTNLFQTVYLACLNVLWIEKGIRAINLLVVAQGSEDWMSAYSLYFGLSIKLVFIFCIAIMIAFGRKNVSLKKHGLPMIILFLFGGISVLMAPDYLLAFTGITRLFSAIVLYFGSLQLLNNESFKRVVVVTLVSLIAFQAIVGTYQFLSSSQIAIYLNDAYGLRQTGYFTSDGPSIFRVTGLVGHPTYFGSLMVLLLPVLLWKMIESYKNIMLERTRLHVIVFLAAVSVFILSCIAIYGSFSRSAWIISILSICVFIWTELRHKSRKLKQTVAMILVVLVVLIISIVPSARERIATIPNFISNGSGKVRVQLIEESLMMISHHPLFGVGPNHFVRAMAQRDLVPELRGFMFPVHNTFLLFASEMGIPMVTVFIIVISMSLIKLSSSQNPKNNIERIAIYTAIVSFVISSQFHALYNQDPTFELLFIFLAWSQSL